MKAISRVAAAAVLATITPGCMTITKGSHQSVTFVSVPPGARVTVDAGGPTTTTTPGEVKLERDKSHVAVVEKEGFQTTAVPLKRDVSMNVFGNFACIVLFPICFGIDFLSGNAFELKPDPVTITLVPVEAPPVSAAPPAPLSAAPPPQSQGPQTTAAPITH
jgi:hypothetical protein